MYYIYCIDTNTTVRKQELDIPRLLAIISDLASEFESNLTRKLNETLANMTLPTCTTPTPIPPVTSEYDANYTGSVIAKVRRETQGKLVTHLLNKYGSDFNESSYLSLRHVPARDGVKAVATSYYSCCTLT